MENKNELLNLLLDGLFIESDGFKIETDTIYYTVSEENEEETKWFMFIQFILCYLQLLRYQFILFMVLIRPVKPL